MLQGKIFNIQRFCTDDGDGIRTVVFLKGCPLRCLWCHNPESQSVETQLAYDAAQCLNCGACVAACPNRCHEISREGVHVFHRTACTACGACGEVCPSSALECAGEIYTAEDVLQQVLRDRVYYRDGGGLTLSGGEPLFQEEFSVSLAKSAKEQGLNVCIETSGACSRRVLEQICPSTDCFLFDYKCHPDDYKRFVGADFCSIEENLAFLAGQKKRIILRCPIVPGCIREDHYDMIGKLAEKYGIREVDLLAYHNLGVGKGQRFGLKAQQEFPQPDKSALQHAAQELMKRFPVKVRVL